MRVLVPNSTQIPDLILDHWMSRLGGAEFKVLLYIARRTYGFGKASDNISLNQISKGIKKRDGTILDEGTGLSIPSVTKALNQLVSIGIVIKTENYNDLNRGRIENTYSINLNWCPQDNPSDTQTKSALVAPDEGYLKNLSTPEPKENQDIEVLKNVKEGYSKNLRGGTQKNKGEVLKNVKRGYSKNLRHKKQIQETVQETAARESAVAVELFLPEEELLKEKLVEYGVNRFDAKRLAKDNPEECRRQLEFINFQDDFRSSKGAYLRSAIEQGFAPPKRYLEEKEREKQEELLLKQRESTFQHQKVIQKQRQAFLNRAYCTMCESFPDVREAFTSFIEGKKQSILKFKHSITPERLTQMIKALEQEEVKFRLFEEWLDDNPEWEQTLANQAA
ncbi:MAG: replication protein [Symploca sp. SIO2G7]|nr:replication protein [Symploca sp. SIO2G7]